MDDRAGGTNDVAPSLERRANDLSRRSVLRAGSGFASVISVTPLLTMSGLPFVSSTAMAADQELPSGPSGTSTAPPPSIPHSPKRATKSYTYPDPFVRKLFDRGVRDMVTALGLRGAGYHDLSYTAIPGGVAVRPAFERVGEFGKPVKYGRFDIESDGSSGSIDWFSRNVLRQEVYYRQLAFLLTTDPRRNLRYPTNFTKQYEAFVQGHRSPDEEIRKIQVSPEHDLYALIYLYVKGPADKVPRFTMGSRVEAVDHLRSTGVETGEAKGANRR
jgi:hypothetical protein